MLLCKLGYHVVAVSGKTDRHAWLHDLGARDCVGRDDVLDEDTRPLLRARWAAAIDTVGGSLLASLLRAIKNEGCIACCGLAGGSDLTTTVYPFILRGVTLAGIDSAWCPMIRRQEVWHLLARKWKPQGLDRVLRTTDLDGLQEIAQQLLSGRAVGRTIVNVRK
jgi:putative YhdH/YhfP family quinone oxidoreductase